MKQRQKSTIDQKVVGSVRTGETVPAAGTWRSECSRPGCNAVTEIDLHQDAPATCCLSCLNPTTWNFLNGPAVIAPPAEVPKSEPKGTSIRTREIVPASGTWLIRCEGCRVDQEKTQDKGAWADPCPYCHKPAVLFFLHGGIQVSSEAPAPFAPSGGLDQLREIARSARASRVVTQPAEDASVTIEQEKSEPAAEREPTLFEKLKPTGKQQR
jgi:hypothetical protein